MTSGDAPSADSADDADPSADSVHKDVYPHWPSTESVLKEIGAELRHRREAQGLSLEATAGRMPYTISRQTLSDLETASTPCALIRFYHCCWVLDVDPLEVQAVVFQRVAANMASMAVVVDLHALIRDDRKEWRRLRVWAARRLGQMPPETTIVRVSREAIREMAIFLECTISALTERLVATVVDPELARGVGLPNATTR